MFKKIIFLLLLAQQFSVQAKNKQETFAPVLHEAGESTTGIIIKVYGEMQYGAATIYFKTYEQLLNTRFFIERSINGRDFTELAEVASRDGINFIYKDSLVLPTGFYRIKTVQADTAYSDILRLSSISGVPQIKVLPLVFDAAITVEINSSINETFNVVLTNSKGKELSSRLVNADTGINKIVFDDGISFLYSDEYTMSVTGVKYSFSQSLYKK